MSGNWLAAAVALWVAAISHGAWAVEPREVDASRVDQNLADQSQGRIDQNRVDAARVDKNSADESRVGKRHAEQPAESDNSARLDDPLARNNVDRDDTSDGVYPLDADYSAALVRCERMTDPGKTQCIAATNAKFGRM